MDVMKKATNDKRLIDANALDERFDKRVEWLRLDAHDKYSLGLYHGAATDKDLIGEMPTVDAVEVVRCRDCKYWKQSWSKARNSFSDMEYIGVCELTRYCRREIDFCSYGKRKDSDGNG